jgi:hypothetical protein
VRRINLRHCVLDVERGGGSDRGQNCVAVNQPVSKFQISREPSKSAMCHDAGWRENRLCYYACMRAGWRENRLCYYARMRSIKSEQWNGTAEFGGCFAGLLSGETV